MSELSPLAGMQSQEVPNAQAGYISSLLQGRMVSPIHTLHLKRWQESVKADNLFVLHLHDFLCKRQ
jgi:hypothetical protein